MLYVILHALIAATVVIIDLFRSRDLSGPAKATWLVALLIFPVVAVIGCLIARVTTSVSAACAIPRHLRRDISSPEREIASPNVAVSTPVYESTSASHWSSWPTQR